MQVFELKLIRQQKRTVPIQDLKIFFQNRNLDFMTT